MQNCSWIDRQTRTIVLDFVLFNKYTDFYTMATFIATFEPNGVLGTKIVMYNLKRQYYAGLSGFIRLLCEGFFFLNIMFYIVLEVYAVIQKIKEKRKESEKEDLKEERRQFLRRGGVPLPPEDENLARSKKIIKWVLSYLKFVSMGLKDHY